MVVRGGPTEEVTAIFHDSHGLVYPVKRPWKRSDRGNLWRKVGALRAVCIRPNLSPRGKYSWLLANDEEGIMVWSPERYSSEREAFEALRLELEERGLC
jgi:hypothetical protein